MKRFSRRTTFLYALLAFVMLIVANTTCAVLALMLVERSEEAHLHLVAHRVPAVARESRGETFAERAASIIARLQRDGVQATVEESGTSVRISNPAGRPPDDDERDGPPPDGGEADLGPPPLPFAVSHQTLPAPPFALLALLPVAPENVTIPGGRVTLLPATVKLVRAASTIAMAYALACACAILIAFRTGRYISAQAMLPLRAVIEELRRFGGGDFEARDVTSRAGAEYAELTSAYNAAAAQVKRALSERLQAEKQIRQFVADAAHELRTPLTIVNGYVDLLQHGLDPQAAAHVYRTIRLESRRMRDLITNLLALARLEAPRSRSLESVDLATVVEATLDLLPGLETTNALHVDIRTGIRARCDPLEMQDALVNLLVNAANYAPGASIFVRLFAQSERAVLSVGDDGPGMTSFDAGNAFRRFYRGASRGEIEGSGLGLSIVERVVKRAGGEIALVTAPGAGTRYVIDLPIDNSYEVTGAPPRLRHAMAL